MKQVSIRAPERRKNYSELLGYQGGPFKNESLSLYQLTKNQKHCAPILKSMSNEQWLIFPQIDLHM
jgi:hypothetical protein